MMMNILLFITISENVILHIWMALISIAYRKITKRRDRKIKEYRPIKPTTVAKYSGYSGGV